MAGLLMLELYERNIQMCCYIKIKHIITYVEVLDKFQLLFCHIISLIASHITKHLRAGLMHTLLEASDIHEYIYKACTYETHDSSVIQQSQ